MVGESDDCEAELQSQKREGKRHATNIDRPVVYVFQCFVMSVDKAGLLRGRTASKKHNIRTAVILVIEAIQCQLCLTHRQSVPLTNQQSQGPKHLHPLTAFYTSYSRPSERRGLPKPEVLSVSESPGTGVEDHCLYFHLEVHI